MSGGVSEAIGMGSDSPRDPTEETAVHVAASAGQFDAVEQLIQAGSNLHRANKNGQTALHLASLKGHSPVVEQLI